MYHMFPFCIRGWCIRIQYLLGDRNDPLSEALYVSALSHIATTIGWKTIFANNEMMLYTNNGKMTHGNTQKKTHGIYYVFYIIHYVLYTICYVLYCILYIIYYIIYYTFHNVSYVFNCFSWMMYSHAVSSGWSQRSSLSEALYDSAPSHIATTIGWKIIFANNEKMLYTNNGKMSYGNTQKVFYVSTWNISYILLFFIRYMLCSILYIIYNLLYNIL